MSENSETRVSTTINKKNPSNRSLSYKKGSESRFRGRNDKANFKKGGVFKAKKECYFSKNHINFIDYKNVDLLKRFLGKNGRILPRRITGTKMIHQRMLANAVKRARFMGLLPFVGSIWSQDYYEQQNREYLERKKQMRDSEVDYRDEKKKDLSEGGKNIDSKKDE